MIPNRVGETLTVDYNGIRYSNGEKITCRFHVEEKRSLISIFRFNAIITCLFGDGDPNMLDGFRDLNVQKFYVWNLRPQYLLCS